MDTVLLKQRDHHSVEIKARHLLSSGENQRTDCRLSVFFFFPEPFHVTPKSYPAAGFFDQLKLNLRFNTPSFSLEELLEPLSDASPLTRIEKLLRRSKQRNERLKEATLVYESKMLAAVFKSLLRDFLIALRDEGCPETTLDKQLKTLHEVPRRYHELTETILASELTPETEQQILMVDEHLSLLLEKYLTSLLLRLSESREDQAYQRVVKILLKEEKHRARRGYPSLPSEMDSPGRLEEYVYREKMLKGFASEVLFFDVRRTDTSKRGEHFLYALAAGIAMVFATAIAFFGQTRFGSLTTSLFVILVLGYMIKDRVKDLFRDILRQGVGRHINDRTTRVYDRRKRRRLATITERAGFLPERKLPEPLRLLRNRGYFDRMLFAQEEERIFLYSKRVRLSDKNIRKLHSRINGVAEINAVELGPFLRHLTAQFGLVPTVENKKRVELKRVKRIYHLNLIVAYDGPQGETAGRFRLVVDAQGIRRIDPITVDGAPTAEGVRLVTRPLRQDDGEFEE